MSNDSEDRQNCINDIKELVSLISDNLRDFDYPAMLENVEVLVETLIELEEYDSPATLPSVEKLN